MGFLPQMLLVGIVCWPLCVTALFLTCLFAFLHFSGYLCFIKVISLLRAGSSQTVSYALHIAACITSHCRFCQLCSPPCLYCQAHLVCPGAVSSRPLACFVIMGHILLLSPPSLWTPPGSSCPAVPLTALHIQAGLRLSWRWSLDLTWVCPNYYCESLEPHKPDCFVWRAALSPQHKQPWT